MDRVYGNEENEDMIQQYLEDEVNIYHYYWNVNYILCDM